MREIMEELLKKHGHSDFYPVQRKFIEHVEKQGYQRNFIISAPTTSGKTLIAEALIEKLARSTRNALILYVAPTISLLNEKKKDFQRKLSPNIKICRSLREVDLNRPNLLLLTPEVLFETLKSDPASLAQVSLAIIDEIHLLASRSRGLELDITLTFLKGIFPELQFVLMSATIAFGKQMVEWLDADIIEDRSRTAKLDIEIRISKRTRIEDILEIAENAIKEQKIVAIFRRTKPDVHSLARALLQCGVIPEISDEVKQKIRNGLDRLKIDNKSHIDYELEEFYLKGIGIHHADIRSKYKDFCEAMVTRGYIPIVICTTTLGLGINLPIDIAVISEPRLGQNSMTPSTFIQISGRAGRSGFSRYGKSIMFVSKQREQEYWEEVRDGKVPLDLPVSIRNRKPREITEYVLRLVNTEFFKTWDNIKELESNLFSTFVSGNHRKIKIDVPSYSPGLSSKVSRSLNNDVFDVIGNQLFDYNLVTETEKGLQLTDLGRLA
ncbi:MAG: DEAD/DEAH box helicase, partial [Candidatus Odinarchaeota archaeon]